MLLGHIFAEKYTPLRKDALPSLIGPWRAPVPSVGEGGEDHVLQLVLQDVPAPVQPVVGHCGVVTENR